MIFELKEKNDQERNDWLSRKYMLINKVLSVHP